MDTTEELLQEQLKDLFSAENQLTKALPRMAKGANSPPLKAAFEKHLRETQVHVQRLEKAAQQMDFSLRGKKCKGMEGLIEEGKEALDEDGEEALVDAGIIAAAQKVEHYEVSAYGSARALAERLGLAQVAKLLQQNLDEESAADEKLTQICERLELPAADER